MNNTGPTLAASRRADAVALFAAAIFPTFATWLYFVAMRNAPTVLQQSVYTAGKVVQFGFPLIWAFAIRREGLKRSWPSGAGAGIGLAFGAAIFTMMTGMYFSWLRSTESFTAAVAPITAKVTGFGVAGPAGFIALGVFYCVVHSLLEEYYWRWFLFSGLRRHLPLAAAIVLSSVAFAAHHVIVVAVYFGWSGWQTPLFSLGVAVGGAVWAWLYARSGSLLGPWLSHLLIDAAIFAIGYSLMRW